MCDEPEPELVLVSVPVAVVPTESESHDAHDARKTMETRTATMIDKVFLFIFYLLLFFSFDAIIREKH